MDDIPAGGGVASQGAKRGRPKGARNKRSQDLGRYIEAFYGGMTPGQQAAAIGMVTPADLRAAKRAKKNEPAFGRLELVVVAMTIKARALSLALDCSVKEAWDAMRQERAEVMPYIHQRQAQLDITSKGKALAGPAIFIADAAGIAGGGLAGQPMDLVEGDYDLVEENQPLSLPGASQVYQSKSTDPK